MISFIDEHLGVFGLSQAAGVADCPINLLRERGQAIGRESPVDSHQERYQPEDRDTPCLRAELPGLWRSQGLTTVTAGSILPRSRLSRNLSATSVNLLIQHANLPEICDVQAPLPLLPAALVVYRVFQSPTDIQIRCHYRAFGARCPCCRTRSRSVHSRYERRLADLPWQGRAVTILIEVRRLSCVSPNLFD